MSDYTVWPLREFGQDLIFLGRQVNFLTPSTNASALQIDLDCADRDDCSFGLTGKPVPQCGADASEQLLGIERLGEIIVCPEIEPGHAIRLGRADRGEHDDGVGRQSPGGEDDRLGRGQVEEVQV